jgi:hypothetical protein
MSRILPALPASSRRILALALAGIAFMAVAVPAAAQVTAPATAAAPAAADPELSSFAKAFVAVGLVRDDFDAQLAMPKNKTLELQAQIRKDMKTKIEETIRASGLTLDVYKRVEYTITVDPTRRAVFDALLTEIARAG